MNSKSERNRLVEENIKLAYYYINKIRNLVPQLYAEEIESDAFYALVKTAATYDASKGTKFATLYDTIFWNEIKMRLRNREVKMRSVQVSLDSSIVMFDDSTTPLLECIPDKIDIEDEVVAKLSSRQLLLQLRKYSKRCYLVFRMTQEGIRQREIAETIGVSQSYVSRIMKHARRVLMHLYEHGTLPERRKPQRIQKARTRKAKRQTRQSISPELLIGEINRRQISNVSF